MSIADISRKCTRRACTIHNIQKTDSLCLAIPRNVLQWQNPVSVTGTLMSIFRARFFSTLLNTDTVTFDERKQDFIAE